MKEGNLSCDQVLTNQIMTEILYLDLRDPSVHKCYFSKSTFDMKEENIPCCSALIEKLRNYYSKTMTNVLCSSYFKLLMTMIIEMIIEKLLQQHNHICFIFKLF